MRKFIASVTVCIGKLKQRFLVVSSNFISFHTPKITKFFAASRHSQGLLRALLQHKHYEDLALFKQSLDDLIEVLSSQSGMIDLQPLFFRWTLVSTEFLFGERLPAGTKVQLTGVDKQAITLVLSSTEGCEVEMASTKDKQ
ncbi:MAG: hypothetical protein Q9172_006985 [Xanthocarpia lactea]